MLFTAHLHHHQILLRSCWSVLHQQASKLPLGTRVSHQISSRSAMRARGSMLLGLVLFCCWSLAQGRIEYSHVWRCVWSDAVPRVHQHQAWLAQGKQLRHTAPASMLACCCAAAAMPLPASPHIVTAVCTCRDDRPLIPLTAPFAFADRGHIDITLRDIGMYRRHDQVGRGCGYVCVGWGGGRRGKGKGGKGAH